VAFFSARDPYYFVALLPRFDPGGLVWSDRIDFATMEFLKACFFCKNFTTKPATVYQCPLFFPPCSTYSSLPATITLLDLKSKWPWNQQRNEQRAKKGDLAQLPSQSPHRAKSLEISSSNSKSPGLTYLDLRQQNLLFYLVPCDWSHTNQATQMTRAG
jgi:hypothetical protein